MGITGDASPEDAAEYMRHGADQALSKPINKGIPTMTLAMNSITASHALGRKDIKVSLFYYYIELFTVPCGPVVRACARGGAQKKSLCLSVSLSTVAVHQGPRGHS
jgi:hypothetical protein